MNSISPGDYNLSNNLMLQTSSASAGFKTKYYKERMMNEQLQKQVSTLEDQNMVLSNENKELKLKIKDMTDQIQTSSGVDE